METESAEDPTKNAPKNMHFMLSTLATSEAARVDLQRVELCSLHLAILKRIAASNQSGKTCQLMEQTLHIRFKAWFDTFCRDLENDYLIEKEVMAEIVHNVTCEVNFDPFVPHGTNGSKFTLQVTV